MKLIFYPIKSKSNDYVNLMVKSLEENGNEVLNKNWNGDYSLIVNSLIAALRYNKVIFHFNWIEDNAVDKSIKSKFKCFLILLFFKTFHFFGGKLVWTMHNNRGHNCDYSVQEEFIKSFLSYVDLVVVHCSESRRILEERYRYSKSKILFVPHGNYCSIIDDSVNVEHEKKNDKGLIMLYFGSISEYKGVDKLILAFKMIHDKDGVQLRICGKPNSKQLLDRIIECAGKTENIFLNLNFLSNSELSREIKESDIVILPYEKDSMQNSGSAIMAFSCGKPVIISLFGYIKDIKKMPFVLTYDYNTKEEQIKNLKNRMETIIDLKKDNERLLKEMGKQARAFAKRELDWNVIGNRISVEYDRL